MRKHWLALALVSLAALSCNLIRPPFPPDPGNLFIHLTLCDLAAFKKDFAAQIPLLKKNSFSAYSLHRDLKDPKLYILTLKCSNLNKGVGFIQSSTFETACPGAQPGQWTIWCGLDTRERKYETRPKPLGGIVIARNQVRSYDFWKACFDAEGQHHHADRGYRPSRYSIHHLEGKPASVLVVHEASDVAKAPTFMEAPAMKGVMEASGVTGIEVWYGTNLEEGVF